MPMIMPWRRWSNGSAASSTTSSVAAAPVARKPEPIQGIIVSEVASSAATITTRRQRPARIQSSASATAWVVLAQAVLICVFGPRAPISSANCEWPIDSIRNRKPAVERVRLLLELVPEVVDAPLHLGEHHRVGAVVVEHPRAQRLERRHPLAAHAVGRVARHLVGHLLETRERRGEDHAGVVAQLVGQRPAVGKLGARGRGLVAQHERDAGVAQGVDAGGDRQLRVAAERGQPVGVDPELVHQVERAGAGGELDHRIEAVDRLEPGTAVLRLDQARDVLVEHLAAQAPGDHVDSLLAVQQPRDVGVVEQPLRARQPERRRR